jgi:HNH endonuclease
MPRVPRVRLTCPQCHKDFALPPSIVAQNRKHCSRKCYVKASRVTLECEQCHGPFTCRVSHKDQARFCSKTCQNASQRRVVTLECRQCHRSFKRKPSSPARFCSSQCRGLAHRNRLVFCCKQCGTTFDRPASDRHVECCSQACAALFKTQPGTQAEKAAFFRHRRRFMKHSAPINDLSVAQWREIKVAYHHRCVYCPPDCKLCHKKAHKLTQDHVTPYTKNGSNTVWNVVPACLSCNSKKNNRAPLNPIQPLLLTVAPPQSPRKRKRRAS